MSACSLLPWLPVPREKLKISCVDDAKRDRNTCSPVTTAGVRDTNLLGYHETLVSTWYRTVTSISQRQRADLSHN